MDIADRRRPHDGSTQTNYAFDNDPVPVDLRVSTYPSICGEKAVIRLLPQRNRFETLADLGFTKKALST
ncbi:MAG: type II/IV secretion system protein, partial [Merismopedia sp. SIO2A8]|nr:type II/IV secretion system protein [Merismopedia sp. SIO2A8]